MVRFLFQLTIVVVCGLASVFAAVAFLMTAGVRVADHQDYFSPGSDASTAGSSLAGGLVIAVAALIGFGVPMLLFRRSEKSDRQGFTFEVETLDDADSPSTRRQS